MQNDTIKEDNSPLFLQRLLQNNQIAQWETIYRAGRYESMVRVGPSRLPEIYTHKLVFRELRHSTKQTKYLFNALEQSKFTGVKLSPDVRLGMRFYDYSGRTIFDLYTASPFSIGIVNGQTVSIGGTLPTYLKNFVSEFFE